MNLRICFAGTPPFAEAILSFLSQHTCNIIGVYTQPDKPAGRGRQLTASPVKKFAEAQHYPIFQPNGLKTEAGAQALTALQPDLMIVVAYGLILPPAILSIPRYGCINVHASLLPRWRGAAPIQRAIEAGDTETGVTIMQMDAGLDTGDMLAVQSCSICPRETSQTLHEKLIPLAQTALFEILTRLDAGHPVHGVPQPKSPAEAVTYANKIQKAEAELDWHDSAIVLDRKIRAFNPWPIAFSCFSGDTPIRIWSASVSPETHHARPGSVLSLDTGGMLIAAGDGTCLNLEMLQLPGKKPQPIRLLSQNKILQELKKG